MRRILTYIRVEAKLAFISKSTYRAATILSALTNTFLMIIYIYLWKAICASSDGALGGYDLNEMILYILIVKLLKPLYPFGVSQLYGGRVKNGDIANYLLKPVRMEWQLLGNAIGKGCYDLLTNGGPALILSLLFVSSWPRVTASTFFLLFAYVISAYAFVFVFELCIGVISYYTSNLWGVNKLKRSFMSFFAGELLPLTLYPQALLKILRILPFASVYLVPSNIFMGISSEFTLVSFIIVWLFTFVLLTFYGMFSHKITKNIMVYGG
jgi:ABC-2 type transport system permease protein